MEYIKARPALEEELCKKVFYAMRSGKGNALVSVTSISED
jgi:hypothetical protein